MTVEYHGLMLITFYTAYVTGLEEHASSSLSLLSAEPSAMAALAHLAPAPALVTPLLRVLTPVVKAYATNQGMHLMYAVLESLGGVGYLENTESEAVNMARLFRDACVLSIWEGTTDVLSTDLVRALKHPREGAASRRALGELIAAASAAKGNRLLREWDALRSDVEGTDQADLLTRARNVLWKLAEIIISALYISNAQVDGSARIRDMCARHLERKRLLVDGEPVVTKITAAELASNQAIVYGNDAGAEGLSRL
jgi:hypothetical protein